MKLSTSIIALLALATVLTGCAGAAAPSAIPPTDAPVEIAPTATRLPPTEGPTNYPLTITDEAGRTVTIEAKPAAIISLAPSNTEILFALGLADSIVGVTEYCNYPPEALEKPKVGEFSEIDLEAITAAEPDLILAANLHITEVVPALEELGMTVVVIDPPGIISVSDGIRLVAEITDTQEGGEILASEMDARIAATTAALEGKEKTTAFWELSSDLWTAGPDSFINDLIEHAGGENIAVDADAPWVQLSNETIIEKDPQVIFLADHQFGETAETVASRPGWGSISAVVNNRVVEVDDTDVFSRPGPRVVDALESVARALHPEAFD